MGRGTISRQAIAVIRADLAGGRRSRYQLNLAGLARRHDLEIAETLVIPNGSWSPIVQIISVALRLDAKAIIAPSLAHVSGTERYLTIQFDLYVVGRSRVYRRGHRWWR